MPTFKKEDLSKFSKVYIYGAGELGNYLADFSRANNIHINGFIDMNANDKHRVDYKVVHPDEILDDKALIIEGIFNPSKIDKIKFKESVFITTKEFLISYSDNNFENYYSLCAPSLINDSSIIQIELLSIFNDDKSKKQINNLVDYQFGKMATNFEHEPPQNLYFDPEIINPNNEIHFMDCGAFNGDTIIKSEKYFGSHLRSATAIEPSQAFLNSSIEAFCSQKKIGLHYYSCGLSDVNGFQGFTSIQSISDAVKNESNYKFWFSRIDDLPLRIIPNFIKFDIEGSELSSLKGGLNFIKKYRPSLAISLYHKPRDFYEIPIFLSKNLLDYNFYFRQYADNCWETVLYAVPKNI